MMSAEQCEKQKLPVCPYCGTSKPDWWDCGLEKDKATKIMCDNESCEKWYGVILQAVPTFDTWLDEPNE